MEGIGIRLVCWEDGKRVEKVRFLHQQEARQWHTCAHAQDVHMHRTAQPSADNRPIPLYYRYFFRTWRKQIVGHCTQQLRWW